MVSCLRGKYIPGIYVLVQYCCLYWFVYQVPVYFLFGDMYIRARGSLLYNMHIYMCNYSGYVYVELCLYVWPSPPGKVANPARGQQLNRENELFAVLVCA